MKPPTRTGKTGMKAVKRAARPIDKNSGLFLENNCSSVGAHTFLAPNVTELFVSGSFNGNIICWNFHNGSECFFHFLHVRIYFGRFEANGDIDIPNLEMMFSQKRTN